MSTLRTEVDKAAYEALCKTNPKIVAALKAVIRKGQTARQVEHYMLHKYGSGNITATSAACAAYHIEAHPELLETS